jgi:hypothetical protein
MAVSDFFENLGGALEEVQYKLATDTEFYILLVILLIIVLYLFYLKTHFLG